MADQSMPSHSLLWYIVEIELGTLRLTRLVPKPMNCFFSDRVPLLLTL